MRNISTASPPASRPIDLIPQIIAAIIGGLIVFSLLVIAVVIGYNVSFSGKIFPGVAVAGVDISGLEPSEAAQRLQRELDFPAQGKILFREGQNVWLASPVEVGFFLNPQASAAAAYELGRTGDPLYRLIEQFKQRKPQRVYTAITAGVMADDQGWGDLSGSGNPNLATPNLDQLAQDGARFAHFFVCPVCSPTRAALITGMSPAQTVTERSARPPARWAPPACGSSG